MPRVRALCLELSARSVARALSRSVALCQLAPRALWSSRLVFDIRRARALSRSVAGSRRCPRAPNPESARKLSGRGARSVADVVPILSWRAPRF